MDVLVDAVPGVFRVGIWRSQKVRGSPTAPIQTIPTLWAICEMARGVREENLSPLSSLPSPCPSALFFSSYLLSILTLHPSRLVFRPAHFNFILRCPSIRRVNFPFSLFRASSTSSALPSPSHCCPASTRKLQRKFGDEVNGFSFTITATVIRLLILLRIFL